MKIYSQKEHENDRTVLLQTNKQFYNDLGVKVVQIKNLRKFQLEHELHARL